jgi:hypothetical protein
VSHGVVDDAVVADALDDLAESMGKIALAQRASSPLGTFLKDRLTDVRRYKLPETWNAEPDATQSRRFPPECAASRPKGPATPPARPSAVTARFCRAFSETSTSRPTSTTPRRTAPRLPERGGRTKDTKARKARRPAPERRRHHHSLGWKERRVPRILFVAATSLELEPLRRQIAGAPPGFAATFAVTGVGKASAALQTALAIGRSRPRLVVQVGCAGAFRGLASPSGTSPSRRGKCWRRRCDQPPPDSSTCWQISLPALAGKGSAPAIYNEVPLSPIARSTWQAVRRMSAGRFHVKQGLLATVSSARAPRPRRAAWRRAGRLGGEHGRRRRGALRAARSVCV